MLSRCLVPAAVALVVASAAAAGFGKRPFIIVPPAPPAKAPVGDPSEPPLRAEVAYEDHGRAPAPGQGKRVSAVSSAKGTTLTLDTPGWYKGSAWLTFKEAAPPMRFTVRLACLHELDLESLTVRAGRLNLGVGPVGAGGTTKYFDAMGREQKAPERAAYTVTARRWGGGVVDVQLRRAPGAALSRELTVSWKGMIYLGEW
jgi:hypothetical protein